MTDESQLELPLPEVEDNIIYFESTTLDADVVLARSLQQFDDVFIIGLDKDGLQYRSNRHEVSFWVFALEKAKRFLMENMY